MNDIVERLNDSLSAGYSELRKEAAEEILRLRAKIEVMERQEPDAWAATDETKTVVEALGMNQSRRFDSPLFLAPGAKPTPSVPKLHVGNLPTVNRDDYPALGAWWVQLWDGDSVFARVYGESPEEAHNRASMLMAAQPAPSVPEKIKRVESGFKGMFLRKAQAYKQGWNECRAAMLAASPRMPDQKD